MMESQSTGGLADDTRQLLLVSVSVQQHNYN